MKANSLLFPLLLHLSLWMSSVPIITGGYVVKALREEERNSSSNLESASSTDVVSELFGELHRNEEPVDHESERPSSAIKTSFPDLSFQHNIYLTHRQQCKWLREAGAATSNISVAFQLGKTYLGSEICALYINPSKRNLPLIWIDANLVARDWLTSASTLFITDKILFAKEAQAIKLRRNYRFIIVPNMNPDGYKHTFKENRHWIKNRRPITNVTGCIGVHLNHNFDAKFQDGNRYSACNDNYAGDSSFSEVETLAVSNIFEKFSPVSMVFSLFSFGQMWLLPYACCSSNPHGLTEMSRVAEIAVREIKKVNKLNFEVGRGGDLLGGLNSGSFYDWSVLKHNVSYSYSILVRPASFGSGGYTPDASNINPSGKELFSGISASILNARLP